MHTRTHTHTHTHTHTRKHTHTHTHTHTVQSRERGWQLLSKLLLSPAVSSESNDISFLLKRNVRRHGETLESAQSKAGFRLAPPLLRGCPAHSEGRDISLPVYSSLTRSLLRELFFKCLFYLHAVLLTFLFSLVFYGGRISSFEQSQVSDDITPSRHLQYTYSAVSPWQLTGRGNQSFSCKPATN